jgi:hypothetical protein
MPLSPKPTSLGLLTNPRSAGDLQSINLFSLQHLLTSRERPPMQGKMPGINEIIK